jgi:hypothetical protein
MNQSNGGKRSRALVLASVERRSSPRSGSRGGQRSDLQAADWPARLARIGRPRNPGKRNQVETDGRNGGWIGDGWSRTKSEGGGLGDEEEARSKQSKPPCLRLRVGNRRAGPALDRCRRCRRTGPPRTRGPLPVYTCMCIYIENVYVDYNTKIDKRLKPIPV